MDNATVDYLRRAQTKINAELVKARSNARNPAVRYALDEACKHGEEMMNKLYDLKPKEKVL